MYSGGYTGKVLRIDLTQRRWVEENLPVETARDFIGGAGFTVKYLFDEVPADSDPLGPQNKLIFAPGPFTGTKVPCASRMAINAKSPLTGAMGVGLTGGHFPVEMKRAGYDVIIIEGAAQEPTWVWIKDGNVSFRSADALWGMQSSDTQQAIKDKLHDQNVRISCIGPAGEKLSRIACIVNERRVVGRRGLGAVMGAKNLKAVALRGDQPLEIADEEKFGAARKRMLGAMKDSPVLYSGFAHEGTSGNVENCTALGIFPSRNWTTTGDERYPETIGGRAIASRGAGRTACAECPVACSQMRLAQTGPYAGIMTEGPEYETLYSFGGVTGVTDPDAVIAADRAADEYGLDTMSAGVTIAFAMELFERGIITTADTGGIDLRFGNHEAMVDLIRMMGERQGFGDVLADGVKVAAERIGKGSGRFALHVKGLELPAYDVRGAKAHGLGYATSYTGADHNKGYSIQEIFGLPFPHAVDRFAIEGKGALTMWNQDARTAVGDCPTMCIFMLDTSVAPFLFENTAAIMEGATGLVLSAADVQRVGERVNNLARAFNTLHARRRQSSGANQDGTHPRGARQGSPDQPGRPRPDARRVLRDPRLDGGRRPHASQARGAPSRVRCRSAGTRVTTVHVRTIGLLSSLMRQGEFDVSLPGGATVADLLDRLSATYGGEVAEHLNAPVEAMAHPPLRVMVNGRDIGALDDRATVLTEGDEVLVLTPVAGG
jgi:aldehyde:ferredoxin oxidoreductase